MTFPPLPSRASIVGYLLGDVRRGKAHVYRLDGEHAGCVVRDDARKVWQGYGTDSVEIPGGPWGTQDLAARAVVRGG